MMALTEFKSPMKSRRNPFVNQVFVVCECGQRIMEGQGIKVAIPS